MDVLYGVRMAGPLAPYARGLAGELARLGFTELSARGQLGLAAHPTPGILGVSVRLGCCCHHVPCVP